MPRLDQLLARNTGWSRRELARAFRRQAVRECDGTPIDNPARSMHELPTTVWLGEHRVELYHRVDVLLHKPVGVVTARRDDRHPHAFELVRHHPLAAELRAIGRLDLDCSGLLLWTNEGSHVHAMTHPRRAVPRRYHVALAGPWRTDIPHVRIDDHDVDTTCIRALSQPHVGLRVPPHCEQLAAITLTSGRFHEVKRIFASLGTQVIGLCRVQHGAWSLPDDLAPGESQRINLDRPSD
ncbi:MAG: rRNA pseudouridine synthase [Myxococcales bacterium FL481]|nr:MAG: rRNA pseudouridine synthase [Myxococcales bacterium FL481]